MTASKIVAAAASSVGGAGLDVDEVFSTYLYTGNGSTQTITNGIDLSGEGGLVWTKNRDSAFNNFLYDTERGVNKYLISDSTIDQQSVSGTLTSFNSNGFTLGASDYGNITNGNAAVSWTFRKAPKFFDVVTYTGTGGSRTLNHNLGSTPGMIIVKDYSNAGENWTVYHRGIDVDGDNAPETDGIYLNTTGAAGDESGFWNDTAPTSTQFTVGGNLNSSFGGGANYVAYLFAHNDGDGEFGPDSDQDIIKCGSYTGNASGTGPEINLGFEPQWLLVKNANNSSSDWLLLDVMRGWGMGDADIFLEPNTNGADQGSQNWVDITPTGFKITNSNGQINGSGQNHIYMAIRRGPLAVPDDATKVFAIDTVQSSSGSGPAFISGFVTDHMLGKSPSSTTAWISNSRLTGTKYMQTSTTGAEFNSNSMLWYYNNGVWEAGSGSTRTAWMWKRAPGYFDVVAYTGNSTAGRTVTHNLGVAPEMIWLKRRDYAKFWYVYHKDLDASNPSHKYLVLNETDAVADSTSFWNDTEPTSSVFTVGDSSGVNSSGGTYIAYLFATVAGVSKVGSYTGNSSDGKQIDCGFSNGARFVLLKNTTVSNTNWLLFDTVRGIVAGNDARLYLNTTDSENSGTDYIDPYSSGFELTANAQVNYSGSTYIFYAIA